MKYKRYSFAVNSYHQAVNLISLCHDKKVLPIIYIKYFIIKGFGIKWIKVFKNLLIQHSKKKKFKMFIDCKKNYGMVIDLVEEKMDYIKVDGKKETLIRLRQIAKKNKVLLNPHFSIVDISKIKNIEFKINKLFKK